MRLKQISDAGTAASKDFGTSAGDLIELDSGGKLPAVDGSQLTNLPAGGGSSSPSLRNLISNTGPYTIASSVANGSVIYISTVGESNLSIIYLPKASDVSAGTYYTICRTYDGAQGASIYPASGSSDTINGQTTTLYLAATDSFTMMSDGSSNWIKLGYGIQ